MPLAVLWRRGPLRALTAVAALGELVADKAPGTPSRLLPGPLIGRVVLGGVAGAALARRRGAGVVLPTVVAAAAAVAGSRAGAAWRARFPGVPAALAEDAVVLLLSWSAAER